MRRFYSADYPPIILDIEASGFGVNSYPIEVGFADHDGSRFCSLIQPLPQWTHWSDSAEAAHGISRSALAQRGQPALQVARELNLRLQNRTVYSDGWVVDHPWLMTLYFAVGMQPSFQLSPIEMIMTEHQVALWNDIHEDVIAESSEQRHRASTDAWIIQQTWIRSHFQALQSSTRMRLAT